MVGIRLFFQFDQLVAHGIESRGAEVFDLAIDDLLRLGEREAEHATGALDPLPLCFIRTTRDGLDDRLRLNYGVHLLSLRK